jgi:ACS family allantoate permease-like MFS transporter
MPALIMFVAQWYRKQEQGVRTGIYMSFTTWGGILGAGVAYALYKAQFIDRSMTLAAWRVLFYILGALTVLIGIIFGLVIPDTPSKAWFLNEQDREIAVRRTAENMEHMDEKRWNWAQVREALKDPQVLLMLLVSFTTAIPNGGITK